MATESTEVATPETPEVQAVSAPIAIELRNIRSIVSRMIHPMTGVHFFDSKDVPHVLDSWCLLAIEAGALKLV